MATATSKRITVTVPFQIDPDDLWQEILGSAFETNPWWWATGYRFIEGDEYTARVVEVFHRDEEDEDPVLKTYSLNIDNIVDAIKALIADGHRDIAHALVDGDWDAERADAVIQQACFGEIVFG
jgi:hypothetical protein